MARKIRRTNTVKKRQINQEKKKLQIGLIVLAVAAVLLAAIFLLANPGQQASQGLPATVSTVRGYELYQQDDVFVLDVRNQDEWDEFHIPNTTLIPLKELAGRVNEVPKDAKILVVCNSGNRSDEGRDILKKAGYSDVTSMDGGVSAWRKLGYPVVP